MAGIRTDDFWVANTLLFCPNCGAEGLLEDDHKDRIATHLCIKCGKFLKIEIGAKQRYINPPKTEVVKDVSEPN
jgi:ribosomal protein S27AE